MNTATVGKSQNPPSFCPYSRTVAYLGSWFIPGRTMVYQTPSQRESPSEKAAGGCPGALRPTQQTLANPSFEPSVFVEKVRVEAAKIVPGPSDEQATSFWPRHVL
jgi:hypothetical protein